MKFTIAELNERAKAAADAAGQGVAGFYQRHGKHVRLGANLGVYALGCVVLAKATTVAGTVGGAVLAGAGAVGLGCSCAEYIDGYISTKPTAAADSVRVAA